MSLSMISELDKKREEEVQKSIYSSIDNYENIIFSAGAGAGKTYALIESLKYIIGKYGKKLNYHNQKIICITYTNVATEEIKERLGHSDLVKISTIHERMWDLIKDFNDELLKIHIEKLKNELKNINFDLYNNENEKVKKKFLKYRKLGSELQKSLKNIMLSKKDIFYDNYDQNAAAFRACFEEFLKPFPGILSNIDNFKKTVNTIYKIGNYEKCLRNIAEERDDFQEVKYDSRFNSDILHKMIISHDTLLEYALIMTSTYDLFKQIVIDSYPFILIDEYQDTNEKVIQIMKCLSDYSNTINHRMFIGYFGDVAQNIYDDGVGSKIKDIHPNLIIINKKYNRRSHKEIIDIINKIRNDEIEQKSIFMDCTGGSVEFYTEGKASDFIDCYVKKWDITNKNKLHCLVLTNKLMSKMSGFINIYNSFACTNFYKKYYKQINTELLSNDTSKLGKIPILFYRIIEFKRNIEEPKTSLLNIIKEEVYSQLTFLELQELLNLLGSLGGNSIGEYIKSIFEKFTETKNNYFKYIVRDLINLDEYTYQVFLHKLHIDLDEKFDLENNIVRDILDISISEYYRWYEAINEESEANIIFHTYHGTKGAEYKNVIIIMQNDFGRSGRNKFSSFFKNYDNIEALTENDKQKYIDTKNLVYVSCSRAIKNLSILYLDDVSSFKEGIEDIFGKIKEFIYK